MQKTVQRQDLESLPRRLQLHARSSSHREQNLLLSWWIVPPSKDSGAAEETGQTGGNPRDRTTVRSFMEWSRQQSYGLGPERPRRQLRLWSWCIESVLTENGFGYCRQRSSGKYFRSRVLFLDFLLRIILGHGYFIMINYCFSGRRRRVRIFRETRSCDDILGTKLLWRIWQCRCCHECRQEPPLQFPDNQTTANQRQKECPRVGLWTNGIEIPEPRCQTIKAL